MLRMFSNRVRGTASKGPIDQMVSTANSNALTISANSSQTTVNALWGWGSDVATMLTNIRAEAPSVLVGGSVLMQPKLYVYGYATYDIIPLGNSPIQYELIISTPVKGRVGNATLASTGTAFAASWAETYDVRPTGFESFPDTSLLQNTSWWNASSSGAGHFL